MSLFQQIKKLMVGGAEHHASPLSFDDLLFLDAILDSKNVDVVEARGYLQKGLHRLLKSELEPALACFTKLVKTASSHKNKAFALFYRGIILTRLELWGEAIADFDLVSELSPELSQLYLNRGICFHQLGKEEEALEDFNRVIESLDSGPELASAYYNRSAVYETLGNTEGALGDIEQAIKSHPEFDLFHIEKARLKQRLEQTRQKRRTRPSLLQIPSFS